MRNIPHIIFFLIVKNFFYAQTIEKQGVINFEYKLIEKKHNVNYCILERIVFFDQKDTSFVIPYLRQFKYYSTDSVYNKYIEVEPSRFKDILSEELFYKYQNGYALSRNAYLSKTKKDKISILINVKATFVQINDFDKSHFKDFQCPGSFFTKLNNNFLVVYKVDEVCVVNKDISSRLGLIKKKKLKIIVINCE